ncbi:hypothetical protein QUB56_23885 [Microcoleus sp. AR_TQ3_B6]|uniref:hypothetical protein n=1 Tax=Microcoleus sp. AR_TQ3_B6 TaxID=3055284 RepID=UPI002FD19778
MLEINFQHIRPYNRGVTDAFEELSCQIFHRLSDNSIQNFHLPQGSQFQRFRGAGGDGGVEALWILPNGKKWGLQSKFFEKDKLESSEFNQMRNSLETAVNNHPEITLYIYCIPFNPTGKKAEGKQGKSQTEKLNEWKEEQLKNLRYKNINLDIEFWTESKLRDYLLAVDKEGGLRRYWFDHEVMTNDWLKKRLNDAEAQAGKRYSPKLSVNVPAFDALEAFAYQDTWQKQVEQYLQELNKNVQEWHSHVRNANELAQDSYQTVENITDQLISLTSVLRKPIDLQSSNDLQTASLQVNNLIENIIQVEEIFLNELLENHGKNADTPQFRQFQAEHQCNFPAAKLDTTRDLLKCLHEIAEWSSNPKFLLPISQFMLLRGCAGVGKTHAIVDHALHISKTGQICLVFYGEDFTGDEPWKIILNKLGLSSNISRDELWGMIDSAAEATEKPAIIYIDALNESPEKRKWKTSWLKPLCQQITNFPRLKLCVSCRDTYLDEVFGETSEWVEFEHNGFLGREFDAIKQFFEFYQLEPPATPLLQSEFANPLFLHLVCQAIQGIESRSIPLGSLGFTDLLHLFFEEKNKRIAEVCRYDNRDDNVTKAVNALATKMAEEKTRLLSRETAREVVNQIFSVEDSERSLFIQLEKEGLIALIEQRTRHLAPKKWCCRFTFERVADFLIALYFLEGIETNQLNPTNPNAIPSLAQLSNIVRPDSDKETFNENKALLEAFSIILPEKFKFELTDVINNNNIDRYQILLPIIGSGFQWRAIESFSEITRDLVYEGLSNSNCCSTMLDSLFGITAIPNHPLNAEFINDFLNKKDLTTRDPFWCALLHEDFEKQKGAWRLIEWSLKADLSSFSEESSRLWALFLSWCCAASDRRVRDRATKGLTRFFVSHPSIIKITLTKFLDVDDDYVLERVSLAAYSSILLVDDNDLLQDVANTIYTHVFDIGNIPENALIRDWLRLIVELASSRHLLNNTINISKFRPPYNSLPIQIPSEEDIAHLKEQEAFQTNMNLDEFPGGFGGTDFARYILEPRVLRHYYSFENLGIEQQNIHRWFIKSVSELGYPGLDEQCYEYDRDLMDKYGSLRGRPTWVERLGKKYYWILLQRLAGVLADHLPRQIDSWENETSLPRLQGIDLRDIDPTDLRAFSTELKINTEWYQPVNYDLTTVSELTHDEWIALPDFPDLEQIIQITDNQGERWVHLSLDSSLKKVISNEANAQESKRRLITILRSVYVPSSDIQNIIEALSNTSFFGDLDIAHDYKLLMAEYPKTIAYQQRFETGEISLRYELIGTENAQSTTIELLRGNEWEYDCSQNEYISSLKVPVPDLVNFNNLKWDGKSSWLDESKTIQINEISTQSSSGVLIKSDYLKNFLETSSLAIVLIGYQEKSGITGHSPSPSNRLRNVYIFDGHTIIKAS